jgi:hypothetical protein
MHVREVGERTGDYVDLDLLDAVIQNGRIAAKVIYIDDFGNVITNIPHSLMSQRIPSRAVLQISGHSIPFLQTYGQVPVGGMLSVIGSHGFLEIAVNQGSAAEMLGLHNGDRITIEITSHIQS